VTSRRETTPYRVAAPPARNVAGELRVPKPDPRGSIVSFLGGFGRRAVAALGRTSHRGDAGELILRVEHGNLVIAAEGLPPRTLPLAELQDVELDTRSFEKVEGRVRPDGLIGTGQALTLEVSRLVLVIAGRDVGIPLREEYASYSDSLEWMGKVRLFLRRHGWLPHDERQA